MRSASSSDDHPVLAVMLAEVPSVPGCSALTLGGQGLQQLAVLPASQVSSSRVPPARWIAALKGAAQTCSMSATAAVPPIGIASARDHIAAVSISDGSDSPC